MSNRSPCSLFHRRRTREWHQLAAASSSVSSCTWAKQARVWLKIWRILRHRSIWKIVESYLQEDKRTRGRRTWELMGNYDNFRVSNGIINPEDIMEKLTMHGCTLLNGTKPCTQKLLQIWIFRIKIAFYGIITYTCSRHLIQFPGYHNRNH